jgi:hypothetical protein
MSLEIFEKLLEDKEFDLAVQYAAKQILKCQTQDGVDTWVCLQNMAKSKHVNSRRFGEPTITTNHGFKRISEETIEPVPPRFKRVSEESIAPAPQGFTRRVSNDD